MNDNPAARLSNILNRAANQPQNAKARDAWAKAFQLDNPAPELLLEALAELANTVAQTKRLLEGMEDIQTGLYLQPFKVIDAVLSSISLNETWSGVRNRISSECLQGLRFVADTVRRVDPSEQIPQEQINKWRDAINELLDDIELSAVDPELRQFLSTALNALRKALQLYSIKGNSGLLREVDYLMGGIVRQADAVRNAMEDPKSSDALGKALDTAVELSDAVRAANLTPTSADSIGSSVQRLLEPPK